MSLTFKKINSDELHGTGVWVWGEGEQGINTEVR